MTEQIMLLKAHCHRRWRNLLSRYYCVSDNKGSGKMRMCCCSYRTCKMRRNIADIIQRCYGVYMQFRL